MNFSKVAFNLAGAVGILLLFPMYFLEQKLGMDHPPAITHPEFYYGFIGVGLAWQFAFFIIARDPIRYQLFMLPSMFEKFSYAVAVTWLVALDRMAPFFIVFGFMDYAFGILFGVAYLKTRKAHSH